MLRGQQGQLRIQEPNYSHRGEGLRMEFNTLLNSVDPAVREEIVRLHAAVDEFAIEMKARLAEKAIKGMRGWDQKENYRALANRLRDQALSPTGQEVDIANVDPVVSERRDQGASINELIVKQPAGVRAVYLSRPRSPACNGQHLGVGTEVTPRFMGSILGNASRTPLC